MTRIKTAEGDDFSVTVDSSFIIFSTVMSEMAFHEPRLGMMRIDGQNSIDEYLSDFPPFFGNRPCSVRAIDTYLRILVANVWPEFSSKNGKGFHLFDPRMSQTPHVV